MVCLTESLDFLDFLFEGPRVPLKNENFKNNLLLIHGVAI